MDPTWLLFSEVRDGLFLDNSGQTNMYPYTLSTIEIGEVCLFHVAH